MTLALRLRGALVLAAAVVLLVAVLLVATTGPVAAVAMCIAVACLVGVVVFGFERAGFAALVLAFATAPMYRGLEGLSGGVATPTDLFLVLAIVLLVPGLLSRHVDLPAPYVAGLVMVALGGLVASLVSVAPVGSLFSLIQWLFFLGGLPVVIAWWRPGTKTIVALLWAYVVGQTASTAYALATGPVVGNRYQGLAHHTNAFGMAGLAAIAILMYLFAHHRGVQMRVFVVGAGVISTVSIVMSGSRAALVVAAVLVMVLPFVERSASSGLLLGAFGALSLVAVPLLVEGGQGGSALTRLAGDGTATIADQARTDALDEGLRRLWESPIIGSGLVDIELIHNVLLEVVVGAGILGLIGWLMVMFVLCRPLLTQHVHRRLSYLPLGFVGMAAALPSIWDRTMWVPIGLAVLATLKVPSGEEPETGAAPGHQAGRHAPTVVRR